MIELLKYVSFHFSHKEVQEAANKALTFVHRIKRNAAKNAHVLMQRRSYLDKHYHLVSIDDINKLVESMAHTSIIQTALQVADTTKVSALCRIYVQEVDTSHVYEFQCHMGVLLMLHTGKLPGILCGIRLENIYTATEFIVEKTDVWAFRMEMVPACEYVMYKTTPVSYIHVFQRF